MPFSVQARGSAKAWATSGWVRWNAVSKQATWGNSGRRSVRARIGARLYGWWSGTRGMSCSRSARTPASIRTGSTYLSPPWPTRWPTAASRSPPSSSSAAHWMRCSIAPSCPRRVPSGHVDSAIVAPDSSRARKRGEVNNPSACPRTDGRRSPSSSRKRENFRLDDPAFRTAMDRDMIVNPGRALSDRELTLAPGMSDQRQDGGRGQPRTDRVGSAGQHDRDPGPHDDAGPLGTGQVDELLGQDVARLEVGHEQDVGLPGHRRRDLLGPGGLEADRVVEGQRAIENSPGDLPPVGHLA